MAALTKERATQQALGNEAIIEAGGTIYAGSLVSVNASGKAVASSDTASTVVVGVAQNTVKSGEKVRIRRGDFVLDNSATAAVESSLIGSDCYVEDDHTVADTATNSIVAGKVLDILDEGVVVRIGQ